MSQSSVGEQVRELEDAGFPVRQGTRGVARDTTPTDLNILGSDVWFSRWTHNVFKNYPILSKCLGARFLHNCAKDVPAFVIGVGPSLDEAIEDLKLIKNRGVVISTDAALRALLANGITPDLVVSYDCKEDQNRLWKDIPRDIKIPALINSCAHTNTIMSWPGPILFFNQYHTQDDLCKRILPDVLPELGQIPSSGTVGNMALLAADLMGCDPICAVGMDFAFQPIRGDVVAWKYRAQDYKWVEKPATAGAPPFWEKTEIKELYDNDERISRSFLVKGEEGVEYRTDPELVFYLGSFKDLMPHFKVPIVNCTPNGMIPKLVTDLQGNPAGGYPCMTLADAITKYCTQELQGGRTILKHLASIAPDPRPR